MGDMERNDFDETFSSLDVYTKIGMVCIDVKQTGLREIIFPW